MGERRSVQETLVDSALLSTMIAAGLYLAGFVYYNNLYSRLGFPREAIPHDPAQYVRQGFMATFDSLIFASFALLVGIGLGVLVVWIVSEFRHDTHGLDRAISETRRRGGTMFLAALAGWMFLTEFAAEDYVREPPAWAFICVVALTAAYLFLRTFKGHPSDPEPSAFLTYGTIAFATLLTVASAGQHGFDDGGTVSDRGTIFEVGTMYTDWNASTPQNVSVAFVAHTDGSYFVLLQGRGGWYERPLIVPDHDVLRIDLSG